MKNEKNYKPLPPYLAIGPSSIHGAGIFAMEDVPKGVIIGISHIYDPNFEHDYIRTPLGGFINHSETPNCELIEEDGDYNYKKIKTLKKIKEGKELTLKYSLYKFNANE
jgi:SET domain-containing protein